MLPEVGVVLDAGTGMFRIRDFWFNPELDIFLSHAHLDHVVGLTFSSTCSTRSWSATTVHALPDKLAAIGQHLLNEFDFPVELPCDYRRLSRSSRWPGAAADPFSAGESGRLGGLGLDWPGHSLAYVTDTTAEPTADYIDTFAASIYWCTSAIFPTALEQIAEKTGHCWATQVAEVARAAGAKRLLLSHINANYDDEKSIGLAGIRGNFPHAELAHHKMEVDF